MRTGHVSGNVSGRVRLTSTDSTGRTHPPSLEGVSGGPVSARLVNAKKAASYTGWPYTSIRDMAARGLLPVVRIPGSKRLWFELRDLDAAIDQWKETRE